MPTTELGEEKLTDGKIGILNLLTACGLTASNGEARRLVQQGGVFVDEEKVPGIDFAVTGEQLRQGVKIRKGKKFSTRWCWPVSLEVRMLLTAAPAWAGC